MIFMAIQIPNPGTGNGQTGDNEFALWSKVKGNFENTTHAASRLVGTSNGNLVEMTNYGPGGTGYGGVGIIIGATQDLNQITKSGVYTIAITNAINAPAGNNLTGVMTVINRAYTAGPSVVQVLTLDSDGKEWKRIGAGGSNAEPAAWTAWARVIMQSNNDIYTLTTAAGANTVIDSAGYLRRSTSSERYKDIIADLELDDEAYQNAMQLSPIVYRSTAEADNPDYHYYSFSAEKLGAYDPAFTLWRETETVTDDEGNVTEQPLDERQAEGINLNAIVAFLHATNIKQDKMIKVQAEAIETLTKRIDAMTAK